MRLNCNVPYDMHAAIRDLLKNPLPARLLKCFAKYSSANVGIGEILTISGISLRATQILHTSSNISTIRISIGEMYGLYCYLLRVSLSNYRRILKNCVSPSETHL